MKLTKLFLLIPAFMMIGCKGNTPTPSEEDKSIITEAEFNAIFQDLKLFKEDNVILKNEMVGQEIIYAESDKGITKVYPDRAEENDERYIQITDECFYVTRYKGDEWTTSEYELEELQGYFMDKVAFVPFVFKDFTRDDETKSYKANSVALELDGDIYDFKDLEFIFNEGKPVSATFTYIYEDDPSETLSFIQTYTYGGAHVVLPN